MIQAYGDIRLVKNSEHAAVLRLWEDSVRASHHFITEADIDAYRNRIAVSLPRLAVYCLEEANDIKGFVALADQKIQLLFIHPDAFRKGFGKRLVLFAIQQHRAWLVDVNAQNGNAISFYSNLGFEVYHKFPDDGAGKPYPVWSLRLNSISRSKQTWKEWKKVFSAFFSR